MSPNDCQQNLVYAPGQNFDNIPAKDGKTKQKFISALIVIFFITS